MSISIIIYVRHLRGELKMDVGFRCTLFVKLCHTELRLRVRQQSEDEQGSHLRREA